MNYAEDSKLEVTIEVVNALTGHGDWVKSIIFLAKVNMLCSCSDDSKIRTWNLKNGKCEKIIGDHKDNVNDLINFTDDYFISCSDDQNIIAYDVETVKEVRRFLHHKYAVLCLLKVEDDLFVSADQSGMIIVQKFSDGEWIGSMIDPSGWVCCLYPMIQKKNLIVSAGGMSSSDDIIRLWDYKERKLVKVFDHGHEGMELSIMTYIDPKTKKEVMVSGGIDRTLIFWDTYEGKILHKIKERSSIWCALWFNDKFLITGHSSGMVKLWDLRIKKKLKKQIVHKNSIRDLIRIKDSNLFVCASTDKFIKILKIEVKE